MLKVTFITLGHKMPAWVNQAVGEFKKRLQDGMALILIEIPRLRRGKSAHLSRILEKETRMMSAAIPEDAHLIALDTSGQSFNSEQLADKLERLQQINHHLCFLMGGPEGLSPSILARSQERWSLSKLTLPHTLARLVFLEALYRAWAILHNHPYHK